LGRWFDWPDSDRNRRRNVVHDAEPAGAATSSGIALLHCGRRVSSSRVVKACAMLALCGDDALGQYPWDFLLGWRWLAVARCACERQTTGPRRFAVGAASRRRTASALINPHFVQACCSRIAMLGTTKLANVAEWQPIDFSQLHRGARGSGGTLFHRHARVKIRRCARSSFSCCSIWRSSISAIRLCWARRAAAVGRAIVARTGRSEAAIVQIDPPS